MKICVVGAGAIGGFMGVRLARAGHDIALLARGPHLAAIKANGLKLIEDGQEFIAPEVTATDDLSTLGPQDIILLALKSHQIAAVADKLPQLFHADTVIVTLQNGIPWWYFQNHGGQYENRVVQTVDPGGIVAATIDPDRIIGCIAYPAATIAAPGVIRHVEGIRFPLGELNCATSARAVMVAETLIGAGFKSPVLADIRAEIWLKLWGNLTFNPISALTHATLEGICQYPLTRQLATTMMTEAQTVAEKLGIQFRVTIEKRIAGAEKVGKHKTSMLQDVEAGKPLEIDGMLGAVIECAELTETEVPVLRAVYGCTALLNNVVTTEGRGIRAED